MTRPLTADEAQHVVEFVMEQGKSRAKAQGDAFSEVDYLCGAMAVFFALESQDRIPAAWVFAPMAGKSLLSDSVHKSNIKYLTDALFSLIEGIELAGLDAFDNWQHDPRAVHRAREAWSRATGEAWTYPGRAESQDEDEGDEEYRRQEAVEYWREDSRPYNGPEQS